MLSIRADRPAAAALLVRRGASLDHRNDAGESARDLATETGDAELKRALRLER
jgi:ankyrin repeat protein